MPTTPQHNDRQPPWWWFLPYVLALVVFTAMIVVLIKVGVTPLVAIGVPATLSVAAVSALTRMNPATRHRRQGDDQRTEQVQPRPDVPQLDQVRPELSSHLAPADDGGLPDAGEPERVG